MSKVITSPIKRWAGTVTIADPLTISQARAIESAFGKPPLIEEEGQRVWLSVIDEARLPAISACVESWNLENFNPDPFPASPRGDSHKLIAWLFGELALVYQGESEIPNE